MKTFSIFYIKGRRKKMYISTTTSNKRTPIEKGVLIVTALSFLAIIIGLAICFLGHRHRDSLLEPYGTNWNPVLNDELTGWSGNSREERYTINGKEVVVGAVREHLEPISDFHLLAWLNGTDLGRSGLGAGIKGDGSYTYQFRCYKLPIISYHTLPNGYRVKYALWTEDILDGEKIHSDIERATNIIGSGWIIAKIAMGVFVASLAFCVLFSIIQKLDAKTIAKAKAKW